MTQILSTNTFGEAKWVVSALASNGTHTTIQAAINSASSGDTIFIREGTYTEDLTLKAGVLLTAYVASGLPPVVTIIGNATFTGTGSAILSALQLQTNGNFFATVSGANASILKIVNCAINITNNTGISYTNSNATSALKLEYCSCNITAPGFAIYAMSSVGTLELRYSNFINTGASVTQSSNSAGIVNLYYCQFASPVATSGTGIVNSNYCLIDNTAQNVTAFTTAGTGTSTIRYNDVLSGTASAISIGAGSRVNAYILLVNSSNANAITGAGTLKYGGVTFTNTSTTINVTTQIPIPYSIFEGGTGVSTLTTAYGLLAAGTTATGIIQTIVPGAAGTMLQSGGAAALPTWSTTTFPSTIAINSLLYASAANVLTALLTANNSILATNGAGVPAYTQALPAQVQVPVNSLNSGTGANNTTFWRGDGTWGVPTPGGEVIPGINRLVNGDFQVWQRGAGGSATFTGVSATTIYTSDRWQCGVSGVSSSSYFNQTAGATSGSYLMTAGRTNGNAVLGSVLICQSLTRDMCIGAAGNVVTLSFKALSNANFSSAASALTVVVYSGTGTTDKSGINGAFTGSAFAINTTATLTGALTNFSFSSAALAANVTQLAVLLGFTPVGTAGAADSFSVTDVQLEVSPQQTPFQRKSFDVELRECQRFYSKSFLYATKPAQNVGINTGDSQIASSVVATAIVTNNILWPNRMFAAPTVTTFNPGAANAFAWDYTSSATYTAVSTSTNLSERGAVFFNTSDAGAGIGTRSGIHWTAEAELV